MASSRLPVLDWPRRDSLLARFVTVLGIEVTAALFLLAVLALFAAAPMTRAGGTTVVFLVMFSLPLLVVAGRRMAWRSRRTVLLVAAGLGLLVYAYAPLRGVCMGFGDTDFPAIAVFLEPGAVSLPLSDATLPALAVQRNSCQYYVHPAWAILGHLATGVGLWHNWSPRD